MVIPLVDSTWEHLRSRENRRRLGRGRRGKRRRGNRGKGRKRGKGGKDGSREGLGVGTLTVRCLLESDLNLVDSVHTDTWK